MVNKKTIKEIYRKYGKTPRNIEDLYIPHFLDLLKEHHNLECIDGEIVNRTLDDFNPFKRILIKSLHAVLEFDNVVAFVFDNHILFYDKTSENMHVHFKPEKQSFFARIFTHKSYHL